MNHASNRCPCSGDLYAQCCGRYHTGQAAPTAQALMRSRYSAFAMNLDQYIRDTWHPSTYQSIQHQPLQWLRLTVHETMIDPLDESRATVRFTAVYRLNGKAHKLHELSRFVFENQRWWYVGGQAQWD